MEGILLINKPAGKTSFYLVHLLRRLLNVQKIGHAGTLDPFATGVMIMLIGKNYTRKSDQFLTQDKEYLATVRLGVTTTTYDPEGTIVKESSFIPSREQIEEALHQFQGTILQTPPMYSAKKVGGKKLCDLARQGKTIERKAVPVTVHLEILSYDYPHLCLRIACSKGTYIRSLAHDLGEKLGCGGHLTTLTRTRSGSFKLHDCLAVDELSKETIATRLIK